MELKKSVGGKLLRCGYTTGSCAAAASKAAAWLLLKGEKPRSVLLTTPKGISLAIDIADAFLEGGAAVCAVQKDSGDDPDVTNGALVYAKVIKTADGIDIDGGEGIGRVTKPGLDQPVGAAAINSTPRKMITESVQEVCREAGYSGGLRIIISIPGGEKLAERTFNPRMGIEGGLSVIGTTGIVEPMSHRAVADTIKLELRQAAQNENRRILLTPGNYGEDFAREKLGLCSCRLVNCSNYIGDIIDACVEYGFTDILLVGHIGKLVKLGIGLCNTHSAFGDGRMETLIACALSAGDDIELLREISQCVTTDAALDCIFKAGLLKSTMAELGARIESFLQRRVPPQVRIGYICFTNAGEFAGILCRSENADSLINCLKE